MVECRRAAFCVKSLILHSPGNDNVVCVFSFSCSQIIVCFSLLFMFSREELVSSEIILNIEGYGGREDHDSINYNSLRYILKE